MGFSCGIVGLPNVGKSTLFNAMTQSSQAQVGNFPFCTVAPNVGRVDVPDERMNTLAQLVSSERVIPTTIDFIDIAGLVSGAAQGEGLGNQFLGHIREVDAIVHMVRCFTEGDITHVSNTVDPISDVNTILTELMLADMESITRQRDTLKKRLRGNNDDEAKALAPIIDQALGVLEEGKTVRSLRDTLDPEAWILVKRQGWITSKPMIYVANVSEEEHTGNRLSASLLEYAKSENALCVTLSAEVEAQTAVLEESIKAEMYAAYGMEGSSLAKLVRAGYAALDLQTFFTAGPKETRAWTIKHNTCAADAAGKIHNDFKRGFICAEVISYQDYTTSGGESKARDLGLLRQEGRNYIVKDGDVIHFRFNV